MAFDSSTAGPPHDGHVAKDERTDTLREFAQSASTLRNLLYNDSTLKKEEYFFMDKHYQVLHMAYLRWKRKHTLSNDL
jgi:hypothetical protein